MTTVAPTFTSRIYDLFQGAQTVTSNAVEASGPFLKNLATRIHEIFQHLTPYFEAAWEFLKTNLGMASASLFGACVLIRMSQSESNFFAKSAFFITGISLAVLSGMFLTHAGILPSNIIPVTL